MTIRFTKRQTSLDKFSSFLDFSHNRCLWRTSRELERNFRRERNRLQPPSDAFAAEPLREREDEFWFLHWLKALAEKKDSLARNHLSAYLEEACYWAALSSDRLHRPQLSSTNIFIHSFRVAQDKTNDSEQLLKRFKNFNSRFSRLTSYSQRWLKGAIADAIYKEYRVGKYSDWGLLKSVSKTTIHDALAQAGYQSSEIACYCLLWQCWLEIYTTTEPAGSSTIISQPTPQQIQDIVSLYNQVRLQTSTPLSPQSFTHWMNNCIAAIQKYEKSKCISSYSVSLDERENNDLELSDSETPYGDAALLIQADSTDEYLFLTDYLTEEFVSLDAREQKIINLAYGLCCTQNDIARVLGGKQFQISRDLQRIKRNLLRGVLRRIDVQLNSTAIKDLNQPLEEWLTEYCQKSMRSVLETAFRQLPSEQQELLRIYYGGDYKNEKLDKTRVAEAFTISLKELERQIGQIKQSLQQHLRNYVREEMGAFFDEVYNPIIYWVDKWLEYDALYASMEKKV